MKIKILLKIENGYSGFAPTPDPGMEIAINPKQKANTKKRGFFYEQIFIEFLIKVIVK